MKVWDQFTPETQTVVRAQRRAVGSAPKHPSHLNLPEKSQLWFYGIQNIFFISYLKIYEAPNETSDILPTSERFYTKLHQNESLRNLSELWVPCLLSDVQNRMET